MIYFDNASTTFVYPEVADLLVKYNTQVFFNPSGLYKPAMEVKQDILNAKEKMKIMLGADSQSQIIFLSSATEANNLALFGFAKKGKKILVSQGEHASVYNTALELSNLGYNVDFIKVDKNGAVDVNDLQTKLDKDVCFVSFMHISNETGVINDIARISKLVKSYCPNAVVHCDGVQAFGKIKANLQNSDIDAYTISSHKIHGPKGVGALWVRSGLKPKPQIIGGGQENGLRSGTENTAGIMAFCLAGSLMNENIEKNYAKVKETRDYFIECLNKHCADFEINTNLEKSIPHILSVSFAQVKGETVLHMLEEQQIYVSTGSACSSKHIGNRVLQSMGKEKKQMEGNVRFSFSEFNTKDEAEQVAQVLGQALQKLRELQY